MKRLLVTLLSCVASIGANILVNTTKGPVKGRELVTPGNRTFYGFTAIPYAKPPLGELRFQAPVEIDAWNDVLDATKDPNPCFQVVSQSPSETEDCLFLNVFTPALDLANGTDKLPVIFWLNGDYFRSESSGYGTGGPDWFIERDLVIVTLNYRVGPFGFLATGDLVIPGNAGLKDQQLALQWTYDNIEAFGGDKEHIVLQGQGSGAASVTYQLLNPKSTGLVKYAVAESGSAICPWAWINDTLAYAITLGTMVHGNNKLNDTSSEGLLKLFQETSGDVINRSAQLIYQYALALPVIEPEHEGAFLTSPMYELLEAGNVTKVPLLTGFNSEEELERVNTIIWLKDQGERFDHKRQNMLPAPFRYAEEPGKYDAATLVREAYLGDANFTDNLGSVVMFLSDTSYTRSITRFAELYAKFSPVYLYQFSYKGPMGFNTWELEGAEKVAHGEENYYLSVVKTRDFDNTQYDKFPESDVITHWRLLELWTNFYKYGNPTPKPQELLSNITWPSVSEGKLLYLNINETLEVLDTPKASRYTVWRDIFEQYAVRPYIVY